MKTGAKISAATTGIEMTGGFVGEVAGQAAAGQEIDLGQATLEGIGEAKGIINTSDIITRAINKSEYNINGEKRTKSEIRNIINSSNTKTEDLAKINFEVKGDKEFNNFVKEKQRDANLETQIDAKVDDVNDRKKLVDLERCICGSKC